jgi:DNA-binding transcriptional ArsR family regulator
VSSTAVNWAYKQNITAEISARIPAPKPAKGYVDGTKIVTVKGGLKFVLVTLADLADSEHSCFPGIEYLADKTGIAASTVRNHIESLIALGLVTKETRRRKDGARTSNRYYLDVDGTITAAREYEHTIGDVIDPNAQAPGTGSSEDALAESDNRQDLALDYRQISADLPPESGGAFLNHQVNHQLLTPVVPIGGFELETIEPPEPTLDDLFSEFWKIWPRKVSRAAAEKRWPAAVDLTRRGHPGPNGQTAAATLIIASASAWAHQWTEVEHRELEHIPHAATWLHQQRWEDELPAASARRPQGRDAESLDFVARIAARESATGREIER